MKYYLYFSKHYGNDKMTWYADLIESSESTTSFIRRKFKNAKFEVVRQYGLEDSIVRESRFVLDGKKLVTSKVIIPIDNPSDFLQLINKKELTIGDILERKGFRVEKYVRSHGKSSKHYTIKGDVCMEIFEEYFENG
ncbi:MAG TPA: hypothetical protein HA232_02915 [Methanocellales archaeon]|nr:hypothetical protein [Methanocellales archaeon]